jgi:hypothetical protein
MTCLVSPQDSTLLESVDAVARAAHRPARALLLQALLQLPRIADSRGAVSVSAAQSAMKEFADELPAAEAWLVRDVPTSPRDLAFRGVHDDVARDVMERFHYLRSARPDGRAYGLHTLAGNLVALAVTSPLDVPRIKEMLREAGRSVEGARVVSRVFAFEGSPRNAISFLLSKVLHAERSTGASDLVTYVNPNMGFTGSSYRGSGWNLLGDEPGTTYRYVDRRYITDRRLREQFGSGDDAYYESKLLRRFAVSKMPLAPLLIFGSGPS